MWCHVSSGDIDFDEFKQLVYDGMILEGAIQEYEEAFRAVDDSGNGTIGAEVHNSRTYSSSQCWAGCSWLQAACVSCYHTMTVPSATITTLLHKPP